MHVLRVGEHALLVECADTAAVASTYRLLTERAAELGAADVVPAARTVLLDGLADPIAIAGLIAAWEPGPGAAEPDGDLVEIPTTYDGEDLDEVARQWGTTTSEVVRIHQAAFFRVVFCGFAPGFAYCAGLPTGLGVARRSEPRPRVPAGSVGLAGEYTGIYPASSPGGWQLIGRTRAELWVPGRDRPALLAPGDRVRFVGA
jgi:KipI family sensor histidine kinase inhibitor